MISDTVKTIDSSNAPWIFDLELISEFIFRRLRNEKKLCCMEIIKLHFADFPFERRILIEIEEFHAKKSLEISLKIYYLFKCEFWLKNVHRKLQEVFINLKLYSINHLMLFLCFPLFKLT